MVRLTMELPAMLMRAQKDFDMPIEDLARVYKFLCPKFLHLLKLGYRPIFNVKKEEIKNMRKLSARVKNCCPKVIMVIRANNLAIDVYGTPMPGYTSVWVRTLSVTKEEFESNLSLAAGP